jgi:hypothetical protein
MTGIRSAIIISAAPSPPSPFSTARIPDDHDRMQSCTRTATVMGVMPEDCATCRYCNQGHPMFRRHGCHTLSCGPDLVCGDASWSTSSMRVLLQEDMEQSHGLSG